LELSDWISNLRTVFELLKVGNENISLSKVASRAFLLFVHLDACPAARCSASWQNLTSKKVKIGFKSSTFICYICSTTKEAAEAGSSFACVLLQSQQK
jgi:hypothetical protein